MRFFFIISGMKKMKKPIFLLFIFVYAFQDNISSFIKAAKAFFYLKAKFKKYTLFYLNIVCAKINYNT